MIHSTDIYAIPFPRGKISHYSQHVPRPWTNRIKGGRETSASIAFKVKPRNFVTTNEDTRDQEYVCNMHLCVLKVYRSLTKPPLRAATEVLSLWSDSTIARAVTGLQSVSNSRKFCISRIFTLPRLMFQEIVFFFSSKRKRFYEKL